MARRLGDRRTLVSVLADQENAWNGVLRPEGPAAALAASAELDRLAAELGDDDLAWQAGRARAGALLAAGDLDGIDRLTEREARAAQERRLPRHLWLSLRLRSAMAMLRGDFQDSERLATDADELGRRSIGAAAAMAHGAQLVFLRWLQGRPGQVEALLDRLAAQQAWAAGAWPRLLPLAYAGQGRDADARRLLDRAMAAPPDRRPGVAGLVALVGAVAQLGDSAAAGRLSALLGPWAGHHLAAGPALPGRGRPPPGDPGRLGRALGGRPRAPAGRPGRPRAPRGPALAGAHRPGPRRHPPRPGPARRPGPGRGHGHDRPHLGRPPRHGAAGMGPPGPRPPPLTRGGYPTTGRSAEAASDAGAAGAAGAGAARRWGSTATMMRAWRS